jgi:ATP-dependent RNA helicase DDX47/RRP3
MSESTPETEKQEENPISVEDETGNITFESLGVCPELCLACEQLKWKKPSLIQREALPVALKGKF